MTSQLTITAKAHKPLSTLTILGMLAALFAPLFVAAPAAAASISNITGGYKNASGMTYAKSGDSLTLTITTTRNDNKCVYVENVTNPSSPILLGSVWNGSSPTTFSFSFAAGAGDGVRNLRATPSKTYQNKIPGTTTNTPSTGTSTTNLCGSANADETVATASYTLDNTVPTITGSHAAAPGKPAAQNGWYRDDVVVSFTCSDAGSGLASCTPAETLTGEGANISRIGTATDNIGKTNTATVSGINIDRTAPLTSADAPSGWRNSGVTVTLSPSDNASGVASTQYSLNGGAWTTGTSIELGEGQHTLKYRSTDRAGNVEAEKTATVDIDVTAPIIDSSQNPAKNAAGWNNAASVTVSFTCGDTLSGIASCAAPQTVTAEGMTNVSGTAVDNAGNSNSIQHPVSIDRTAPTILGSQSPAKPASGWNNTDVTVNFTCDDDRSGVVACAGSVPFGEGGNQSVTRSVSDHAGNSASATVNDINVDKTAPTTSSNAPSGWQGADFTLNFSASDQQGLSGVASTEYKVGTGDWTTGTSVTLGEGSHTVLFRSTDRAGNTEQHKTVTVNVDKTAPTTSSDAPSGWQTADVTVTFTPAAGDASGIASTEYKVGSGAWTTGTSVTLGEGSHTVLFRSTDNAGNVETAKSATVNIDKTAPVAAITAPANNTSTMDSSVTVNGTASDTGSGVASVTVNGTAVTLTNGSYSTSVALECGSNSITAIATDGVGRTHSASITVSRTCATATITTVTVPSNAIYTGQPQGGSALVTGENGFSQSLDVSYEKKNAQDQFEAFSGIPTDAGEYKASASFGGNENHLPSSNSKPFSIAKAATTTVMSCTEGPFTYNGAAHTPCSATVTGAGGLNQSATVSYSANVNAGTVTASASYVESANHLSSSDSKPFSIGQKAASVTPNAASKIEGQTDPALSGTLSGFVAADSVTASYSRTSGETVGEYTISAVLSPASVLGNYDITYGTAKFTISAKPVVVAPVWTTKGFFQPVDMGTATNIVYNTVKGGSTVPLKFQVFKDGVEQKDVAVVTGLKPTFVSCTNSPIDDIEVLASGSTALRYDTTAGQFIYNWKTPTALGCYKTSVTLQDGSAITAYFKILK